MTESIYLKDLIKEIEEWLSKTPHDLQWAKDYIESQMKKYDGEITQISTPEETNAYYQGLCDGYGVALNILAEVDK